MIELSRLRARQTRSIRIIVCVIIAVSGLGVIAGLSSLLPPIVKHLAGEYPGRSARLLTLDVAALLWCVAVFLSSVALLLMRRWGRTMLEVCLWVETAYLVFFVLAAYGNLLSSLLVMGLSPSSLRTWASVAWMPLAFALMVGIPTGWGLVWIRSAGVRSVV